VASGSGRGIVGLAYVGSPVRYLRAPQRLVVRHWEGDGEGIPARRLGARAGAALAELLARSPSRSVFTPAAESFSAPGTARVRWPGVDAPQPVRALSPS